VQADEERAYPIEAIGVRKIDSENQQLSVDLKLGVADFYVRFAEEYSIIVRQTAFLSL
jgi:hypothetical protein